MPKMTFSFLPYASGLELLDLMKRYAKVAKVADTAGEPLSWHQNQVAISLGYKNWSLLHKNLQTLIWSDLDKVLSLALKKPNLGQFIEGHSVRTIEVEDAVATMKAWARETYSPLIEFAYYDNESPTGFGWPAVDMADALSEEFLGRYPEELIREVGDKLDAEDGPWGIEKYT